MLLKWGLAFKNGETVVFTKLPHYPLCYPALDCSWMLRYFPIRTSSMLSQRLGCVLAKQVALPPWKSHPQTTQAGLVVLICWNQDTDPWQQPDFLTGSHPPQSHSQGKGWPEISFYPDQFGGNKRRRQYGVQILHYTATESHKSNGATGFSNVPGSCISTNNTEMIQKLQQGQLISCIKQKLHWW